MFGKKATRMKMKTKNIFKGFGDKFFVKNIGKSLVFLMVILGLVLGSSGVVSADETPPEYADDKLAPNDLKPNDLGKNSRDDYKKQHPAEKKKPWIDKYYLHGEKGVMHDTKNRSEVAEKAARYQRPKRGYKNNDRQQGPSQSTDPDTGTPPGADEEVIGGGIYKKKIPKTDKEIVENVWRFSEDLLWLKEARATATEANKKTDTWKFDKYVSGQLDIGKRMPPNSFYCVENAYFVASLLRELGYKVQYKNTVPSTAKNRWGMQTAGINVWYNGQWHFYDPWESIDKEDDYVNGKGNVVVPYHDYKMYKRTKPLTRAFPPSNWAVRRGEDKPANMDGWKLHKHNLGKDGTGARSSGSSRMRVRDEQEQKTGWPGVDADSWNSSSPRLREIPGSGYFDPTSLVATEMGHEEDLNWTPLGEEILFWTFNNTESFDTNYTLEIINPTNVSINYSIDLEINEVDRNVIMISPTTTTINGTLNASETINISLVFQVSAPDPTPPEPVQDLHVNVVNERVYLTWSPSSGADNYTIYRVESIEVPQNTSGGELIGCQITSTSFEDTLPPVGIYFYMVTANSEGGECELHPNEGSVEALEVPAEVPAITPLSFLLALLSLLGLGAIAMRKMYKGAKK